MDKQDPSEQKNNLTNIRLKWIYSLFFYAYRSMTKAGDQFLSSLKLGRAQFRVMFILEQKPGYTMGELRQALDISNQAITRVLKQLLVEAYITQELSVKDRRKRYLKLTPKGKKVIDSVTQVQRECFDKAFAEVGAEKFRAFENTLFAMLSDSERQWMEIAWEDSGFVWDEPL